MKKLEAAMIAAELVQELSLFDTNVIVCDTEGKILYRLPAKTFNDGVDIGQTIKGGSVTKCLKTREIAKKVVPESAFGVKLKTIVCPIIEDDETFSGIIGTATNVNAQETLHIASQSIASTTEEISATTEELSASALHLAESLTKIRSTIDNVITEISKTDEILKFVDSVADNSNMLGINAAIEAARAGEQGKGFAVVAEKIRQMAESSADSVKNIRKIVINIQKEIQSLVKIVNSTVEQGQQQAAATEEIESVMQQLATTAADVEKIADII